MPTVKLGVLISGGGSNLQAIIDSCKEVFTIEHPIIPIGITYMPGVIEYATARVLKRGDSVRRVTKDLNDLHQVSVSIGEVEIWVNEAGEKNKIITDFSDERPPADFSGFISLDGTFKAVKTKKTTKNRDNQGGIVTRYGFCKKEANCGSLSNR